MLMQKYANKCETNAEVETKQFGIGDASVVIEILRNRLYEYKIRTLVQEYISNARDAMREVGKGNNFDITIPTRLSPVFKVRDYGPGISPDRMDNVFRLYGSSTKRSSNNQTGGFGIGAKSAWSYTDSFTVISVVDGIKRSYVAHTGSGNNGQIDLVDTCETTEANGTEIQVAVKGYDVEEFRNSVFRAVYFWADRPTIKGELQVPERVLGHVVSDLVEVIEMDAIPNGLVSGYDIAAIAVVDGIIYPMNNSLTNKCPSFAKVQAMLKNTLVMHFGNGTVEVSASRESIADSKVTVENLEKLLAKAYAELTSYVAVKFAQVTDTQSYLQTYAAMSESFEVDEHANFGEYNIENNWIKSELLKKVKLTRVSNKNRRGVACNKVTKLDLDTNKRIIHIDSFGHLFFISQDESKVKQNKRIQEHLKGKAGDMVLVSLLTDATVVDKDASFSPDGTPKLDADKKPIVAFKTVVYDTEFKQVCADLGVQDFSSIAYVEPPKVVKARVTVQHQGFCMHGVTGLRHEYTTLATNTKKRFFIPIVNGSWKTHYTNEQLERLDKYLGENHDASIVGMAEKAMKTAKGDANFMPLDTWIDAFKPTNKDIVTAKDDGTKNDTAIGVLKKMPNLKDTFLAEMVSEYNDIEKNKSNRLLPEILATKVKNLKEVTDFQAKDIKLNLYLEKEYSLISEFGNCYGKSCSKEQASDLEFYINAKYTKKHKK